MPADLLDGITTVKIVTKIFVQVNLDDDLHEVVSEEGNSASELVFDEVWGVW